MRRASLLTLMVSTIIAFNVASASANPNAASATANANAAPSSALTNPASASKRSLPGSSLESAENDDFFQFFHLKKRAIDERDDLATHYFRPPSRDDVVVCVDTDKSGKILQMSLIVGRDFIDNPRTNIFARDLVKSFIEAATPASGASETSGVVSEIFLRGTGPINLETEQVKVNTEVQNVPDDNENENKNTTINSAYNKREQTLNSNPQLLKTDAPDKTTISSTSSSTSITYNGKKQEQDSKGRVLKIGEGEIKKGDVVILSNGLLQKIPEKISDSFKAFEGKLENVDKPITGAHLIMKNHEVAKGRFLEVRVDLNSVKKEPKLEVVVDESPDKDSDAEETSK